MFGRIRWTGSFAVGLTVFCFIFSIVITGCKGRDTSSPPDDTGPTPVIQDAVVSGTVAAFPYYGDLWVNTLTDDDRLLLAWGDGTGLADCIPTYDGSHPGAWTDWEHQEVYFTGSADAPTWSADPGDAVPLSGIETMAQGGGGLS